MAYKVGMSLYNIYVEDDGKCVLIIHIVRTIRGGFVHAIQKINGITWIKKSKKNGDYGWDNSIDYVWRNKAKFYDLHTTKLAAYRYTLKNGLKYTDNPERATTSLNRCINNLTKQK